MFEDFKVAELNYVQSTVQSTVQGAVQSTDQGAVQGKHKSGNAVNTVLRPSDFDAAFEEISTWENYAPTPLHRLTDLADRLGIADILYKDESPRFGLQSFKALGGAYAGLRVIQRELARQLNRDVSVSEVRSGALAESIARITLTSATDGNHGRSLAWGSQTFGAPCRIYIHEFVSESRARAMRDYGAEVIRVPADYDETVRVTRRESEENGWFVVSDTSWEGYTQPPIDVMSGYGVMIDEICADLPEAPTHMFVQAGVGGLAAAVTARLRQKTGKSTRIIAVEPELAACIYASGKTGKATTVPVHEETLMAGLSCGEPSGLAWKIINEEVTDFLTIPESVVGPTMRLMANPPGADPAITAGESAICGIAALILASLKPAMKEQLGLDRHARVLLIGSEGITDPEVYAQIMQGL